MVNGREGNYEQSIRNAFVELLFEAFIEVWLRLFRLSSKGLRTSGLNKILCEPVSQPLITDFALHHPWKRNVADKCEKDPFHSSAFVASETPTKDSTLLVLRRAHGGP